MEKRQQFRFILSLFLLCFTQLSFAITHPVVTHSREVMMVDNSFNPTTITIAKGQTVTWVNKGEKIHSVSSDDGLFKSGNIMPGGKFSYKFTKPGTYAYTCSHHSFFYFGMKGNVIVK